MATDLLGLAAAAAGWARRRFPGGVGGLLLALSVALGVLAYLVSAGALNGVDRFALAHALARENGDAPSGLRAVVFPFHHDQSARNIAAEAWTFPASLLCSGIVLALCCGMLARRGRRQVAVLWASAWLAGNTLELLGKLLISRPRLPESGAMLGGLDQSFPSGHAIRVVLLAAALGLVWHRIAAPAAIYALTVLVVLVVGASHTPSDVAGGLTVGLLLVLLVDLSTTWLASRAERQQALEHQRTEG